MAVKYKVDTRPRLNGDGIWGAWLLLLSPLANGVGWWWQMSSPGWAPLGIVVVSGLTFLSGFVLLLIGRDYDSTIDEVS